MFITSLVSRISFKKRVMAAFMFIGLVPMICVSIFGFVNASNMAKNLTEQQLSGALDSKRAHVEDYFKIIRSQILTFSSDIMVIDAMKAFSTAIETVESESKSTFNGTKFNERYTYQLENTTGATSQDKYDWTRLDNKARLMQHLYVSGNPHKIGAKENLDNAKDGSIYSELHEKYHPPIRQYLQEFGYYDIFLVDPKDGRIIYSVFKELDYATSLTTGPYANTNFGHVAQEALKAKEANSVYIADFEPYAPSYNADASFISSPIYDKGELIGVVVFQMPVDKINEIMAQDLGLGEHAEAYLLGKDMRMRSSSSLSEESTLGKKISSPVLMTAFVEDSGISLGKGYRGNEVISAHEKLKIEGFDWSIIAEADESEVMAPVYNFMWLILIGTSIALLVIALLGMVSVSAVLNPVKKLGHTVDEAFQHVTDLMAQMGFATQAMSLAAEQSATQTLEVKQNSADAANHAGSVAAAVEEMDATILHINNNTEETSKCVKNAVIKAEETSDVVSNLGQASTKITEVVKIINDIADKINLLSLNAAIEAARAGDAGRGFAVVADEVKKLATSTTKATEDIHEHVNQIAKVSNDSAVSIEDIKKSVQLIEESIDSVTSAVTEQAGATTEISQRINDTVDGISQVDGNMTKIEVSSQETTVSSGEVKEMAEEVSAELSTKKKSIHKILHELGLE